MSPLCDPLVKAESGHEYRLRLKPQGVRWVWGTKQDLFEGREFLRTDELPNVTPIELESDD